MNDFRGCMLMGLGLAIILRDRPLEGFAAGVLLYIAGRIQYRRRK